MYKIKVEGEVDLSGLKLNSIPVVFEYVKDNFDCSENQLTTLTNSPKRVGGDFICNDNKKSFSKEEVAKISKVQGNIISDATNN